MWLRERSALDMEDAGCDRPFVERLFRDLDLPEFHVDLRDIPWASRHAMTSTGLPHESHQHRPQCASLYALAAPQGRADDVTVANKMTAIPRAFPHALTTEG